MKKILVAVLSAFSLSAFAVETITIASPYTPSHSGTNALRAVVDEANKQQAKYNFIIDFKPGAQQLLSVQYMDQQPQDRLSVIAPAFVENTETGKLDASTYVPVYALGDACWAVITNLPSLKGQQSINVGGVGFGNATHLTSLLLADKYNFKVRYVPFKSNFDALVLMAGDNSINLVIDRVQSYEQFKDKNPRMNIVAASCPHRIPSIPNVKTLKEQGVNAPYIWNIVIANKAMPAEKQKELGNILDTATLSIGKDKIQELSDMSPPVFSRVPVSTYYEQSVSSVSKLLKKYANNIEDNKNGK